MEMSLEKTPKSFKTIQFQDCDMFGHLNNGRFIDYFLNAREDHLVNFYDLDIFAMTREKGVAWFVGKHEIVYRKPANLREEVAITSEVINFVDKSITVEMVMYNKGQTHVKAVLRSTFVHINLKTLKAASHDEELTALLNGVLIKRPMIDVFERAIEIEKSIVK